MSQNTSSTMTGRMAQDIRDRVRAAIALNRRPGFHFPGYFLGLSWPHIGTDTVVEEMTPGAHCLDARGEVDLPALGVMIDSALSTAPRLAIELGARMATVHLDAQFTGERATGKLSMPTRFEGFSVGDAVQQALAHGTLSSDEKPVCHAGATFVVLPPPPGARLAPLPWQEPPQPAPAALAVNDMNAAERAIVAACERALALADDRHAFTGHFWGILPQHAHDGAHCTVTLAGQHRNRVGHVQGGLLLALAAATGCAAVPRHPMLSNISAWYISPGQGSALTARAQIAHAGRSFAVVRTQIRTAEGALVLEAVSNHAATR